MSPSPSRALTASRRLPPLRSPDLRFGVGLQGWVARLGPRLGPRLPGYGVRYVDVVPSCYFVKKINRYGQVRMIRVCE